MSIHSELKFLVGKEKYYTTKILEKFIYLINSRAFKVDKKQLTFSRYIETNVKNEVLKKSGHQCEFIGNQGKCCEAKTKLEYAHHYPYSLGGENTVKNLKMLCKTHNLFEVQIIELVHRRH